jgi:hypothetical protein
LGRSRGVNFSPNKVCFILLEAELKELSNDILQAHFEGKKPTPMFLNQKFKVEGVAIDVIRLAPMISA